MQDKEKVLKMMNDGKITRNQADLLCNAIDQSEAKKEKIFIEIALKRQSREKKIYKFAGIWTVTVFILIGIFILSQNRSDLGRDTKKASIYFNEAGVQIEQGNYGEAARLCRKAVEKAPKLSIGYMLLGTIYRLLHEKTEDISFKRKEKIAFKKAALLQEHLHRRWDMGAISILFLFIFLILILAALSVIALLLYNRIIRTEEKVNEAWAQVRNYEQRKLDLIPALLEVVKDYAQHEQKTLESVIQARSRACGSLDGMKLDSLNKGTEARKVLKSQEEIAVSLGKLMALAEKYPDLKANTGFLTIQGQIEETENMITHQRETYNQRARVYNTDLKSFPVNIISSLCNFQMKEYIEPAKG